VGAISVPESSTDSPKSRAGFGFNAKSREAQAVAKRYAAEQVSRINKETKIALKKMISESIRDGIPPREAAKQIREMVGVNRPQALALKRYVRNLSPTLSTAAKEKAGIKLKNKMIRRRAITIARTEVIDSLTGGVELAWGQAQKQGLLGNNAKKEWMTTPVGSCRICQALDGQQVLLKKRFISSTVGELDRPTAHPNCRCGIAPVPGMGGAVASPPAVQATGAPASTMARMAVSADGDLLKGSDARKAILKYAESDEALKQKKIIDAAKDRLKTERKELETALFRIKIDNKVLGGVYKDDISRLQWEAVQAKRAARKLGKEVDPSVIKAIETKIKLREARYSQEYTKLKKNGNELTKQLDGLKIAVDDAVSVQADHILETFVYNKNKNELFDTSIAAKAKLTKADKVELEKGIEAFRRMIDDGIYATTIEGTPLQAAIVNQSTKVHVEFFKQFTGRMKKHSRGSRAFAWQDRDRAYRVKLDYKERSRRGRGTTVHELTHTVEYADPGVLAEALRWRHSFTKDDTLEWLGKLTGNTTYDVREVAYADGDLFKNKYIGKVYSDGKDLAKTPNTLDANKIYTKRDGWQSSSEVSTMGTQAMYQDPLAVAREQPELFDFIYERIIKRKYTNSTSKYTIKLNDKLKLRNVPSQLTPEVRQRVQKRYEYYALVEDIPSTGRPGNFAQRLFTLDVDD
jgi:hypothetical protein